LSREYKEIVICRGIEIAYKYSYMIVFY